MKGTITSKKAYFIRDKVQEALKSISKELGVSFQVQNGKFDSDKFTFTLEGVLIDDEGSRVISDLTNVRADEAARRLGIGFSGPHFIGSVWKLPKAGLCMVTEYVSRNRHYPFYVYSYETEKTLKAGEFAFASGSEVPMPTEMEFKIWFTTDIEDDIHSQEVEEIYDRVNDYMSVKFPAEFFECCGALFDMGVTKTLSANMYKMLFVDSWPIKEIIRHCHEIIGTDK